MAELVYSKTMGMTTADLFRLLPKIALPEFCLSGQSIIIIRTEGHNLMIEYYEKDSLKIGALQLPLLQLDFRFSGYTTDEADAFLKQFDTVYRRGGG